MGLPTRAEIDHTSGRSQRWDDVDEDLRAWVDSIVEVVSRVDAMVGAYLHGSLAMGGFYRPKSDLDVLVVTDAPLDDGRRSSLASQVLELHDRRPITGGIERSMVRPRVG